MTAPIPEPIRNLEKIMYQKPSLTRLGTFRQLTQLGCTGSTDSFSVPGIGTSIGSTPINGNTVCLAPAASR